MPLCSYAYAYASTVDFVRHTQSSNSALLSLHVVVSSRYSESIVSTTQVFCPGMTPPPPKSHPPMLPFPAFQLPIRRHPEPACVWPRR